MNRLIVPAENQNGLNAKLAEHFGRAPYFVVVDLGENDEVSGVKAATNICEHVGGVGQPHDHILELKPNPIIVHGMRLTGINTFQGAGVAVLKTNANLVSEVVATYKEDERQELTASCEAAPSSSAQKGVPEIRKCQSFQKKN